MGAVVNQVEPLIALGDVACALGFCRRRLRERSRWVRRCHLPGQCNGESCRGALPALTKGRSRPRRSYVGLLQSLAGPQIEATAGFLTQMSGGNHLAQDRWGRIRRVAEFRHRLWQSWSCALQNHRDSLADTDAHGCQAVPHVAPAHFMNQRGDNACAACSKRVTECNRPAIHIDAIGWHV